MTYLPTPQDILNPPTVIPPILPRNPDPQTGQQNSKPDTPSGAVEYYYVFVALAIFLVALAVWISVRWRTKLKAQHRDARGAALAQDVDGWPNTRRWFLGTWRSEPDHRRQALEEGLDERGQAPPPYRQSATHESEAAYQGSGGISAPPPAFHLHSSSQKPPDYEPSPTATPTTGAPSFSSPESGGTATFHEFNGQRPR